MLRGDEPPPLRAVRRSRLAQAILDHRRGQAITFVGYSEVRTELAEALNHKCVYCEMALRKQGSPVEHFRPKACVHNEGEARDHSRYWWLAWTWNNLLLACGRCNNQPNKGNQFPLVPGTQPLPSLSFDVDKEQPLLIDPARVEPREHLRFRWSKTRQRWLPLAIGGSKQGAKTIEVLGLSEDDRPTEHVCERVEPWCKELDEHIRRGDTKAVQRTWTRLTKSLFAPKQPFHAVTWDALDTRYPQAERQRWQLTLPRLGRLDSTRATAPVFDDPAGFEEITDDELRLRIRALGDQAPPQAMQAVLDEVLAIRDWTPDELAALLRRRVATVRAYLRERRDKPTPAP
ncbi:MAG: hypothetical protein AAGC55_26045 [Myxococcota bacterium]